MTDASAESANEFLGLCTDLENALRQRGARDAQGIGDAVRLLPNDRVVTRYRYALSSFASLRNAIAHERYRNGEPIAAPLPAIVEDARRVLQELTTPTLAFGFASVPLVAEEKEPLRDYLLQMEETDVSQMPVRADDGTYKRLLTTNAVARWLAHQLDAGGDVIVEDVRVADVIPFLEADEVAKFVSRNITAAEAVHLLLQDSPPIALLLAEHGKPTEKPIRILVRADVPNMQSALQL